VNGKPDGGEVVLQPVELTDKESVAEMLERSLHGPILLYKHSRSCPISGHAWYQIQECLEFSEDPPICYRVTVQYQPELSRSIAESLDVVHHTPQLIILRDGRASYVASHWQIRKQALQHALMHSPLIPAPAGELTDQDSCGLS